MSTATEERELPAEQAQPADRYDRQKNIVPRDALPDNVTVIGVGAIGRQVACMLAAMGVKCLTMYDHDIVEERNCATQGYSERHIGFHKVDAAYEECIVNNANCVYRPMRDRFRKKYVKDMGRVIFCCVDSIDIRKLIWESVRGHVDFFCDGRMLGEYMRILAVGSQIDEAFYVGTLHPSSETVQGRCTSEGVIFTAAIAAGIMCHQFTRWLRGHAVQREFLLNLPAGELSVVEGEGSRHTQPGATQATPAPEPSALRPEDEHGDERDDEDEYEDDDEYEDEYEDEEEDDEEVESVF